MSVQRIGVQYVEIDAQRAGQRLDNFLAVFLKGVPKSVIYRILRTGQVRVNKGRAKPGYKLETGDLVRIPPLEIASPQAINERDAELAGKSLMKAILYEDDGLLVLNKPSGMAVHGGSGLRYGLIEALRAYDSRFRKVELVHRLDRGTSGCLLLAKQLKVLRELHNELRLHRVEKTYMALLHGKLSRETVTIDDALDRNRLRGGERVVALSETGKTAVTHIQRDRLFQNATLAKVLIDTGRTHQIRVHCAGIKHAVAGDDKYGDRNFNKAMRSIGLQRMFLHAQRIQFRLDQKFDITAPLPADLEQLLTKLR